MTTNLVKFRGGELFRLFRAERPILIIVVITALFIIQPTKAWEATLTEAVQNWAELIRDEIMRASEMMRLRDAQENFQNAKMVNVDGSKLLHERANLVRDLLYRRREAVVNIRETAEGLSDVRLPVGMDYPQPYDAVKNMNVTDSMETPTFAPPVFSDPIQNWSHEGSAQFPGLVNTSVSAVHVPSDVYDGSLPPNLTEPLIQHGIWLSKKIEPTFLKNFRRDNTTSYQYFAHIKGFMRLFPAVHMGDETDYYDARFRPWFSSAATSNKNILILLDNSGSMTGKNLLVARRVIHNILDTLNPDDFVNVILFGQNTTNATIKCLEDKLVPATFLNIVELKRSLEFFKPGCPSSLEVGLKYAFQLLNQTAENGTGAMCNQAIMVVTDGPWMDTSIFGLHNEPFGSANKPVRVFTYQVGEELREAPGLKWMACQNQGWYINVTTAGAVRDRVATYIPVMARPWLMHREHLIHWTHTYFHRKDFVSMDKEWIEHERGVQKTRILTYRKYNKTPEELPFFNLDKPRYLKEALARKVFDLTRLNTKSYMVITVSTPAYNRSTNVTSPYGELLGVAGIDIPIEQIRLLVPPYKAGVNNYFFMVNNNGFVIFHPDLRPTFFDIMKPTFTSVDMSELEIDLSSSPGKSSGIEYLREQVVNQRNGSFVVMVEQPFDDMTRVETVKRRYFFTGIMDTPYSLVFAVNDNMGLKESTFRSGRYELTRLNELFSGGWMTHPKWYYCRETESSVPIDDCNLIYALGVWFWEGHVLCDKELIDSLMEDVSLTTWFPLQERTPPAYSPLDYPRPFSKKKEKEKTERRDKEKEPKEEKTEREKNEKQTKEEKRTENRIEPMVTFIATKSGLTRWNDVNRTQTFVPNERHFSKIHRRGPEEVWYRRAALHPELTVVTSGPVLPTFPDDVNIEYEFQEIHRDDMIITASKAVVVDGHKSHRSIPAVVGMQFKQNNLQGVFDNITGSQWCNRGSCVSACGSPHLECFLVDSDSIVIASSLHNTVGFPLGKKRPQVFGHTGILANGQFETSLRITFTAEVTDRRRISDMQPFRFYHREDADTWMSTSVILTAMSVATHFFSTSNAYPRMFSIAAAASIGSLAIATPTPDSIDSSYDTYGYEPPGKIELKKHLSKLRINKTRPQSCTRQVDAMQLRLGQEPEPRSKQSGPRPSRSAPRRHASCPDRPYASAYVPDTSLLFVAVVTNCSSSKPNNPFPIPTNKNRWKIPENTLFDLTRHEVDYNAGCFLAADLDLTRHRIRPHACKTHHRDEELNKTDCGLDHMVPVDAAPPEPPMFSFDYNVECKTHGAKNKDKVTAEF